MSTSAATIFLLFFFLVTMLLGLSLAEWLMELKSNWWSRNWVLETRVGNLLAGHLMLALIVLGLLLKLTMTPCL